jgi:hypothetical protein
MPDLLPMQKTCWHAAGIIYAGLRKGLRGMFGCLMVKLAA